MANYFKYDDDIYFVLTANGDKNICNLHYLFETQLHHINSMDITLQLDSYENWTQLFEHNVEA